MYEELIKRLRDISNSDSNIKSNYIGLTMIQAADAIEELSRFKEECDGCGDKARRVIEKLQKMIPHWIPVTERLPEMGKEVLVYDKQKKVTIAWIVGCFSKDGASFEWACSDGWIDDQLPITHWMPLPTPPKEEA